jgi:hypothetical protein
MREYAIRLHWQSFAGTEPDEEGAGYPATGVAEVPLVRAGTLNVPHLEPRVAQI